MLLEESVKLTCFSLLHTYPAHSFLQTYKHLSKEYSYYLRCYDINFSILASLINLCLGNKCPLYTAVLHDVIKKKYVCCNLIPIPVNTTTPLLRPKLTLAERWSY